MGSEQLNPLSANPFQSDDTFCFCRWADISAKCRDIAIRSLHWFKAILKRCCHESSESCLHYYTVYFDKEKMEKELEMSDEDSYIIEESSSEYESESDSMNGTKDLDSDTELDINNSSYNVAIQPVDQAPDLSDADIIPWSKVMEEENGHFEVDFDTTTSGTKHINSCNEPIDFFYLLYSKQLWNLIVTNTNKYATDQNLSHWKDVNVNVNTMKGFIPIIFNMGLIKKK